MCRCEDGDSQAFALSVLGDTPTIVEVRVSADDDDVEERTISDLGMVEFNSSDLELVDDGGSRPNQTIGLRFIDLNIPQGSTITKAYIQFTVDEIDTEETSLQIRGDDTDNALPFTSTAFDVSNRLTTATDATVAWNNVPAWSTVGDAGPAQQTTDIAAIIHEIVNRPGWTANNSMALIITGTGQRTAESFRGNAAAAPLLHVEFFP